MCELYLKTENEEIFSNHISEAIWEKMDTQLHENKTLHSKIHKGKIEEIICGLFYKESIYYFTCIVYRTTKGQN